MNIGYIEDYEYPYILYFPRDLTNPPTLEEVQIWADQLKIDCVIDRSAAFFKTQQNLSLFILRWL